MTIAVSKTTFFTSGQIKFSDLRSNFKEVLSGSVSASELKRNASTSASNPIVPDATENESVATSTNLKLSQFRNTIKYYTLNQSSTDSNVVLSTLTWNSNLSKNIVKKFNINGEIGSDTNGVSALYVNGTIYNLQIIVRGLIYGYRGRGATVSNPLVDRVGTQYSLWPYAGESGGNAIRITSTGGIINILTLGSAKVYGGGGGGAYGLDGPPTQLGTCSYVESYTTGNSCGSCPGCAAGYSQNCYRIGGCGRKNRSSNYQSSCSRTVYYTIPAPVGGGGAGGNGRGYGNTASDGIVGTDGSNSDCTPYTNSAIVKGAKGGTGGAGGDYGVPGTTLINQSRTTTALTGPFRGQRVYTTPGGGDGGTGGAAITGSNYAIDQDSVSASFKGAR